MYANPLSYLKNIDIEIVYDFELVKKLTYTKTKPYLELFKSIVYGIRNGRIFSWRFKTLYMTSINYSKLIEYDLYLLFDVKIHQPLSMYFLELVQDLVPKSFPETRFVQHVLMSEFTIFLCISLFDDSYVKIEENLYKKVWPTINSLA